jgi:putative flippase GtrA
VKNPRQVLTSGIAGVVGTGVDVGVLVFLVAQHVPVPLATFVAAMAGAVTNFTLNKYVAFRDRSPISVGQVARYHLVAIVGALSMAGAMRMATANPAVPVVAAKLACAAVVFAIWSYPAQRRLVFARRAEVA